MRKNACMRLNNISVAIYENLLKEAYFMRDIISHVLAPQGACWSIINNDNVGPKKKTKKQ